MNIDETSSSGKQNYPDNIPSETDLQAHPPTMDKELNGTNILNVLMVLVSSKILNIRSL